jgi:hypothetical protein
MIKTILIQKIKLLHDTLKYNLYYFLIPTRIIKKILMSAVKSGHTTSSLHQEINTRQQANLIPRNIYKQLNLK